MPDMAASVAMPAVDTGRTGRRRRPQVLPQRRLLWDVKTTFGGHGQYLTPRGREDQSGAVEGRSAAVHTAYLAHARRLDRDHSQPGTTPVQGRLEEFGTVRALVFGSYAEGSSDVHHLVDALARVRARRSWRLMGARTEAEARGFFVAGLRRYVGVFVAREMARHRLHRVPLVGVPRAVLDARPQQPQLEGGPFGAVRQRGMLQGLDFYGYQVRMALGVVGP